MGGQFRNKRRDDDNSNDDNEECDEKRIENAWRR